MKRITVTPLEDIQGIEFGSDREVVRNFFGDYESFNKLASSKVSTDDFGYCHAYYDSKEKLEAMEFFGDIEVLIDGKKVYPSSSVEVKTAIPSLRNIDGSLISIEDSIGITIVGDKVESILFGCPEYYAFLK